jgi:hypothetical protein
MVPQVAAQEQSPLTATASANPTSGSTPLTVQFSVDVSGGIPPYSYFWEFGDLSPYSLEQNPTHTYNAPLASRIQDFDAYVIVMDSTSTHETDVTCHVNITVTKSTPTTSPTETPTTTPTTANEEITLTGMQGNVVVERNGVAITTSSLQPGDQIITGDSSSAIIIFADGSKVKLGPNTTLEITSVGYIQSILTLLYGKIHALVTSKFQVRTPSAVTSVRGTEYVLEVTENGSTTLTVLSHVVDFSDIGGLKTVSVGENQTSVVTTGSVPSEPVSINPSQIDRWWEEVGTSGAGALTMYAVAATAIVVTVIVVTLLLLRKRSKSERLQSTPPQPPPPPPPPSLP